MYMLVCTLPTPTCPPHGGSTPIYIRPATSLQDCCSLAVSRTSVPQQQQSKDRPCTIPPVVHHFPSYERGYVGVVDSVYFCLHAKPTAKAEIAGGILLAG